MEANPVQSRPFLRIFYECCRVYQRIYRNPDGSIYQGRCPRCLRTVKFRVGPSGTSVRAFTVY